MEVHVVWLSVPSEDLLFKFTYISVKLAINLDQTFFLVDAFIYKKCSRISLNTIFYTIKIYTKIIEVNLSEEVYKLESLEDWREIFMKQSVNKCR